MHQRHPKGNKNISPGTTAKEQQRRHRCPRWALMLDAKRIILPKMAIKPITERLHIGHPGQKKAMMQANQLYFWHGSLDSACRRMSSQWPPTRRPPCPLQAQPSCQPRCSTLTRHSPMLDQWGTPISPNGRLQSLRIFRFPEF